MGMLNLNISEKDADYPAVVMANELLGGGAFLSSRIPQRLREAEGMSYGAGSYMFANAIDKTGSWGLYAFFNPTFQEKLDGALKEEINKAISKGFTKAEFDSSLKSWLQGRQTMLGMDEFLARQLRENLDLGRNFNELEMLESKTKALDVKQINAAMTKYFDLNKLVLIYAGDFTKK